ncbi:reverse transcriptase domain-containing protein [Tanacetum coccineum]
MRPVPPSPDRTPTLYVYPLKIDDDSSDEDLSDIAKSLHTQSASTSIVHPSPTQSLPTSLVLANQQEKEISIPLGYRRSRPLPPSLPPSVPPPPEHIESLGDNIEASIWNLERHPGPYTDKLVSKTMTTTNQGMSFAEFEQIIAQGVANAIETIAIYETKTCMARKSMNQIKQQEEKIAENTNNNRKWEGDHKGSSSQQQNKESNVVRAHTVKPSNKEGYAGNLPLCNKCMFHHTGLCAAKCGNCKRFGHQTRYCRTLVLRAKQSPLVAKQKAEVTCYECGMLGHYKSKCPK